MSTNKDAILLRINKEDQVKALRELGFTNVSNDMPLSEIAEHIKWAGGLRDLRITCVKLSDKSIVYFTETEWNALSANAMSLYRKIGVCIRARKREFIFAAEDCKTATGGTGFKYGAYGKDLVGVKNYAGGNVGLHEINTGYEDTVASIEQTAGYTDSQGTTGAPAAEAAFNYKANEDDPLQWYLPSITELMLLCEFKTEINSFLTKNFNGGTITTENYWSSTEYNSSLSWYVGMLSGYSYINHRYGTNRVRPVAVVAK